MSAENEFVLADLGLLNIYGPTVVFLRYRHALHPGDLDRINASLAPIKVPGLTFVTVPPDFEILAAGEAQLRALGWTKIGKATNDKPVNDKLVDCHMFGHPGPYTSLPNGGFECDDCREERQRREDDADARVRREESRR